ncbi:MAG TPA: hypothetical protein VGJ20_30800 [Xanthobacteraceae bacterium]
MAKIEYMNVGSFLQNERYFATEVEARAWCQERWLREVAGKLQLRTFRLTQIDADSGAFLSTSAAETAESR